MVNNTSCAIKLQKTFFWLVIAFPLLYENRPCLMAPTTLRMKQKKLGRFPKEPSYPIW